MDEVSAQRLLDRLDIQDALTAYAASCDTKDYPRLRSLFTGDATARYDSTLVGAGVVELQGGLEIVDWIEEQVRDLGWQHHMVSVYGVEITGETASSLVYLISHQHDPAVPDRITMMTSRYTFGLRKVEGCWRISSLDLQVGWFEARTAAQKELLG